MLASIAKFIGVNIKRLPKTKNPKKTIALNKKNNLFEVKIISFKVSPLEFSEIFFPDLR